jgi:hypothetical protein
MAYAALPDVQARIPTQICTLTDGPPASQPSATQVTAWIQEISDWIDTTLTWRYLTPVTDAFDLILVKQACAALVASRVWSMLGGFQPGVPNGGSGGDLRREAHQLLAYSAVTGRSMIALLNTGYAEARESVLSEAETTFTDPTDTSGSNVPRAFSMSMEW